MSNINLSEYNQLKKRLSKILDDKSNLEIEKLIESIYCTNNSESFEDLFTWLENLKNNLSASVEKINLNDLESWSSDKNGNFKHESGKFFEIFGLRIRNSSMREVGVKGWNQPIISEIDFDGGILGLIRSEINGLPHYLVEAKFEPGNYELIQLSPTLQATFSNIKKAHKGSEPRYYKFFKDYESEDSFIFKQWLSEDGGRLFNKRNLGLVKNIDFEQIGDLDDNFKWISKFQIIQFINHGPYVNPHLARLIFL